MNSMQARLFTPLIASLAIGAAFTCPSHVPAGTAGCGMQTRGEGGGGEHIRTFLDVPGDAVERRSDFENDAMLHPGATLPDLLSLSVTGWRPFNPCNNPYIGEPVAPRDAHIVRLQVVLAGLMNPPGTIGSSGTDYNPFLYGPSPVFGYVEIDLDNDADTGGEFDSAATNRYLANVARFGGLPYGSAAENAARSGLQFDYDIDFFTPPYFERSGADFELALCGCSSSMIVQEIGDENGVFEPGETWVMRGRYFRRTGGYRESSCVFGGSEAQCYDPFVNLQFSHSIDSNCTTLTLVYALDMEGAAILTGECEQEIDCMIDWEGSHSSIEEAMQDVIDGAEGRHGPLSDPTHALIDDWKHEEPERALRVDRWRFTALVGTACENQFDSIYIWTDVGFHETFGDLTGDGIVDARDTCEFDLQLAALDGAYFDDDGMVNGSVRIRFFAANFSLLDFDYNGFIDAGDRAIISPVACLGDFNCDGAVNSQDFFDFLNAFFALLPAADINRDHVINSQDFFDFLLRFIAGC